MSASLANQGSFPRRPPYEDTGSVIHDLAINTAISAREMKRVGKETMPKLNLATTMPKNMTKFVMRLGPLVDFQDECIEIFTWKNPSRTIAFLLAYILLCLYPIILYTLPQILMLCFMIRLYYIRAENIATKPQSKLSLNLSYLKNLQFIQNHMGIYSQVYDDIASFKRHLDWSNEKKSTSLFKVAIGSIFIGLLIAKLVPLNLIFLGGGLVLFVQNTAFFKAASETLPPVLIRNVQARVDYVTEAIANVTRAGSTGKTKVQLFENQRWWAGLGWISHLLRSERPPWSDETGEIARPLMDLYELPGDEWEWVDEWRVDMDWNSTMDQDGWVFTDHHWQLDQNKASTSCLTRRRVWTRTMQLKKLDKKE